MTERAIKIDISYLPSGNLAHDAAAIREIADIGTDTVWIAEHTRNPFFPLTIAAKSTTSIRLATLDALAFPRSPMVTAQIAWDLARQSGGRFVLGLSARSPLSVIEAADADADAAVAIDRMREYIEGLRAIWNTFQNDERLRYRGQYYQFRLMAPFFNPGPIDHPDIPIYLSAANLDHCQLAGETCQGVQIPRLHTASYLREAVLPTVAHGLERAGESRDDFCICVSPLIVTGSTGEAAERARRQTQARITNLANTVMGRAVLSHHNWQDCFDMARSESAATPTSDLARAVNEEMLRKFAIVAEPMDVLDALNARYRGIADRILLPWNQNNRELLSHLLSTPKN